MDENRTQPKARLLLPGIVVLALILVALVGCQTANQSASQPAIGIAPTATIDRVEAGATFDAQKRDQQPFSPADDTRVAAAIATRKVELALTPSQPPTTPPPPQPSPTWELGMLPGCEAPNSHTFGPVSCWRGIINDQMFSIVSGNGGGNGDPNQGVIIVSEGPDFDIPLGHEEVPDRVYDSPDKIGPLHIVSVEGSRVTLGSVNPGINETLVFDIATRQFVPPPCGQGGTCTPGVTEVATPAATMAVAR